MEPAILSKHKTATAEYERKKLQKLLPSKSFYNQIIWKCAFCTFLNITSDTAPDKNRCKICGCLEHMEKQKIAVIEEEDKISEIPPNTTCPQCAFSFTPGNNEICQCGISFPQLSAFLSGLSLETPELGEEEESTGKLGVDLLSLNGVKGGKIKVRFWYPQAKRIRFMGDFNKFGCEQDYNLKEYEMKKDKQGFFSITLEAKEGSSFIGQRFKYHIEKKTGTIEWRNDPHSVMLTGHKKFRNDLIYDHSAFEWTDQGHKPPALNSLIIYETHISSLCGNKCDNAFHNARRKLDYLKKLGINAIELLPVTQDCHEKLCWGYDPLSLFAVHQGYGTADNLKEFINSAHQQGISVIIDWVPNHIYKMSILHEGYFYSPTDEKHGTRYGPRPDYSNPHTKTYLLDSVRSWLEDFHFDGVRVDSLESMRFITDCPDKSILEAWTFLQEMTAFVRREFPEKILIAEDLQNDDKINGLLGFDSQWDSAFFSVMLNAAKGVEDSQRNSYEIAKAIKHKFEGTGFGRVIYSESHDTISDDRQLRIIRAINPANKIPDIFAKRRSRLINAMSLISLGIPMILAGQELMETRGGMWPEPIPMPNFEDFADLTEEQKNSFAFFSDLMRLRLNEDGVSQGLKGVNLAITHIHPSRELPVLAIHRWDKGGPGDDVVVVMNFSNQSFKKKGYWINFPRGGVWNVRICSEGPKYAFDEKKTGTKGQTKIQTELDMNRNDGYIFAGGVFLKKYSMVILSQDQK